MCEGTLAPKAPVETLPNDEAISCSGVRRRTAITTDNGCLQSQCFRNTLLASRFSFFTWGARKEEEDDDEELPVRCWWRAAQQVCVFKYDQVVRAHVPWQRLRESVGSTTCGGISGADHRNTQVTGERRERELAKFEVNSNSVNCEQGCA